MKNLLMPLAKSVLIPLWFTAAESAADVAIQKNIYRSGTYGSRCPSKLAQRTKFMDKFK